MTTKTHIGSNLDGLLREDGIYDQTHAEARVHAYDRPIMVTALPLSIICRGKADSVI